MFIITWIIVFTLLLFLFNQWETSQSRAVVVSKGGSSQIIIEADRQGHYQFEGSINQHKVKFMVDTGASDVAIPQKLASELGLVKYYPIGIKTANGQATGYLTRLNSLSIGPIHLTNVRAVIMPGDGTDTVLLGMNVLAGLEMKHKDNKLTISRK